MDSAKVFMTGRSQAVRLPKAYWFNTEEVLLERRPDGALLLRPKQPRLERDARWWAKHGFGAATPRKRRTKR